MKRKEKYESSWVGEKKLTLMENERDRNKNSKMTGRLVYVFSGVSREAG